MPFGMLFSKRYFFANKLSKNIFMDESSAANFNVWDSSAVKSSLKCVSFDPDASFMKLFDCLAY